MTRLLLAVHILGMNARDEAQDPATTARRFRELIHLPGDRADIDSDSGWCREYVAANPAAPVDVLEELAADQDDFMSRLGVVKNPAAPTALVATLIDDRIDLVANVARWRLGLAPRPRLGVRIPGVRYPFPKEGRSQ